jgi:hypothetical protein
MIKKHTHQKNTTLSPRKPLCFALNSFGAEFYIDNPAQYNDHKTILNKIYFFDGGFRITPPSIKVNLPPLPVRAQYIAPFPRNPETVPKEYIYNRIT